MRRITIAAAAMLAGFISAAPLSAHGAANVFDDAVFWFRGGKDLNGDGYMQAGEFFDDLNANATSHDNHKMSMSSSRYTGDSAAFRGNAVFQDELVVFPALGKNIVKEMQVLRISDSIQGGRYYFPFDVNPYSIFERNNISNEYTIVGRIRLDDDAYGRNECFVRVGYDSSEKKGMWFGFAPQSSSSYAGCRRIAAYRTPNGNSSDSAVLLDLHAPTNTWVDIAVVVGNGKLRVGIATPESSSNHGNNPSIAFAETPMWTDNCTLLADGKYRFFCLDGQTTYAQAGTTDMTAFIGSVQQIAIWGRALSDQEVMAAFGMPRPALFRTGFDNGASNEFGGARSSATQTIDGLGSWQNIANAMKAGDEWTVNFTALRDEAGLPQMFSIRSLPNSAAAQIEVELNGTSLGEGRIAADSHAFWPVAASLVAEGANTLVIKRKDGGTRDFLVDAMEFGGSLGVGTVTASSTDDGRVHPERIKTGVPSAADPNSQHWPMGLMPSAGVTNLHFRVWVDPEAADKSSFAFKTATKYNGSNSGDAFSIYINGVYSTRLTAQSGWKQHALQPSNLHGGWNDFEFICSADLTCYWDFGYFRFETVLPDAFGFSTPPGLSVIIR